jgi:hypothetical protein
VPVWLGLAALLVLALSGCGKAAAPAPSASVTQTWDPTAADSACQVVTEHDASSALGHDPGPGVPSSFQPPSGGPVTLHHCLYGDGQKGVWVEVSTHPNAVSSFTNSARINIAAHEAEPLDGIGEAGFIAFTNNPDLGPPYWRVAFLKGSATFAAAVPLNGRDQAAVRQLAVDLARAAAGRM